MTNRSMFNGLNCWSMLKKVFTDLGVTSDMKLRRFVEDLALYHF
jgi:hypothetical protein